MTFSIELPWPDRRLSPNSRKGWRAKAEATQEARARGLAEFMEKISDSPEEYDYSGPLQLSIVFCPPDNRKRDLDNCLAMMKPHIDGICNGMGIDDRQIKIICIAMAEKAEKGKVMMEFIRLEENKEEQSNE